MRYIFLLFLIPCVLSGQLGQWHDSPHRFPDCETVDVPVQPFLECVSAHINTRPLSITFEYRFGVRDCNKCCAVIPQGVENRLISSEPGIIANIDLPERFCPGYYANTTVFNITWTRSSAVPLSAYKLRWQLGNLTSDTLTEDFDDLTVVAHKPRQYTVNFGSACTQAPEEFLACKNPCAADGSNVAFASHPLKTQFRYNINPIATCGWRDWKDQSVVIIGGGSGLGLSLYQDFKQLGANVKVGGRYTGQRERSNGAYPDIDPQDLIGHNMDVRSSYEIQKAWDYVVRNMSLPLIVLYVPGVAGFSPSNFIDKNAMQELLDINAHGMFKPYQLFINQVGADDNWSRFHAIVSNSAIQHTPTISPYTISKFAQNGIVQTWVNDRLNRQLSGRDTIPMASASYPSAMKTNWAYNDWMASANINYLAPQIKIPHDQFADGTHNNPLVTPAAATSSQIINLLSLSNNIIDALNCTLSIPYAQANAPNDPYVDFFVDSEDLLLSTAVTRSVEEETRYIANGFSGLFIPFIYGQDQCAEGQY